MKNRVRNIILLVMTGLLLGCLGACNGRRGMKVVLPAPTIDFEYELVDGEIMITKYRGSEKEVRVPEQVNSLYPITMIGERAFYDNDNLTYVILPEGIKSIGSQAFCLCDNLEDISIPKSVTEIDGFAFNMTPWYEKQLEKSSIVIVNDIFVGAASNVTAVTIPEEITRISAFAFGECKELKQIAFPESVTQIDSYAFMLCESLKEISISKNITTLEDGVFMGCTSLEEIIIPEGVVSVGEDAFLGCPNLKSIEIPESVTNIGTDALLCGSNELVLTVTENSYAQEYAETNGIAYQIKK